MYALRKQPSPWQRGMIRRSRNEIADISNCFRGSSLSSQIGAQELKSQKEKLSYIVGMDIGKNLRTQLIDVDPAILTRGIKDGLSGGKSVLTDQEVRDTLAAFQKDMIAKRQVLAEKNRKEGEAFLAENKKKKNVTTLPSGLQYKVIKAGTGKKPKPTDTVTVNYRGTLIDGTEFDSSYRRGQPITFPLNGVIPGWTEALGLMQERREVANLCSIESRLW